MFRVFQEIFQKWKQFYLPKRYILVLLGFFGITSIFAMRVTMSIAIVAMVNQTAISNQNTSHVQMTECPALDYGFESVEDNGYKGEKYNWGITTQTTILGSYYYGYFITQLPGGILAEKFGVKWIFGGGILVTAIILLLYPVTAMFGSAAVIAVRVIQGLADGITIPAINLAISRWSPKMERSRVSTIIFSGSQIGTVVGLPVSALLCTSDILGGWPSVFYVFGSISCIWFVFWSYFMYEKPILHPSISKEELLIIEHNNYEQKKKSSSILWKNVFTSTPVYALAVAHFGHAYGFITFLMSLPIYLSTVLNLDLQSNGFLSALPFIVQAFSAFAASFVADYLRNKNKFSITTIRKLMNSIAMFGPALCLMGITFSGCQTTLIMSLLCLAMAFNGCIYSGLNVTHVDMCPEFAGTLYAITNTLANTTGVLSTMSVGMFTESGATLANWNNVFYTSAAIYMSCGAVFALFGSAAPQSWGNEKDVKVACIANNFNLEEGKTKL